MSNPSLPPGAADPRDEPPPRVNRAARERDEDRSDHAPGPHPTGSSSSTMALILHALTFLCCANWLFGVLGIVFAVRAAHKRDQGLYTQAETLTRYSWYCLGAGAVMLLVMLVSFGVLLTQAGSWVDDAVSPGLNY
ncbi:hypothetical protein [Thermobifida cellulosilytica]|uniref:Interferon-induced transmembrane protein n=1 Tax=Thermobifida cellulosilytica TB100 TaxID=665004 RepID=A0A147KLW3_THECS|nr:hypothetical protein [Thermobifida cellulosilytica]KUP98276.1 hypothetical protein AC529_02205 [Thermobifida cellulosilytica TB100]